MGDSVFFSVMFLSVSVLVEASRDETKAAAFVLGRMNVIDGLSYSNARWGLLVCVAGTRCPRTFGCVGANGTISCFQPFCAFFSLQGQEM